jgi:hypothetical protein
MKRANLKNLTIPPEVEDVMFHIILPVLRKAQGAVMKRPYSNITLPVSKHHAIKFLIVTTLGTDGIRALAKVIRELHAPTASRRGGGNVELNSGAMRSLASVSAALNRAVLKTGPEKTQGNGKVNGRSVDMQAIYHTHTLRSRGECVEL